MMESNTEYSRPRSALVATSMAAATVITAGCGIRSRLASLIGPNKPDWERVPNAPTALRVLNRATFGARPGNIALVAAGGVEAFLEEQLANNLPEDPAVAWRVNALGVEQDVADAPDELSSMSDEQLTRQTTQAALLRAVYSRNQLNEVMANFWTNHFNIYSFKKRGTERIPVEIERAVRPHTLGKFRDLLSAVSHSPAMLGYLDNDMNRYGAGDKVNENFARELMELHTVGVHAGYQQIDVHEVARCFSGWSVGAGWHLGQFEYHSEWHDPGLKKIPFLHLTIPENGGESDGEKVIDALATHPATAHHLAEELCMHFIGTKPQKIVNASADVYLKSDTDIKAMLRPILLDGLVNDDYAAPVFRRPFDLIVYSLRSLAADSDCGVNVQDHLANMGEPYDQWPMPDGYPSRAGAWETALLPRWNYSIALATNTIDGTSINLEQPLNALHVNGLNHGIDVLLELATGRPAHSAQISKMRAVIHQHAAGCLKSGMDERDILSEAVALMFASPICQWK